MGQTAQHKVCMMMMMCVCVFMPLQLTAVAPS